MRNTVETYNWEWHLIWFIDWSHFTFFVTNAGTTFNHQSFHQLSVIFAHKRLISCTLKIKFKMSRVINSKVSIWMFYLSSYLLLFYLTKTFDPRIIDTKIVESVIDAIFCGWEKYLLIVSLKKGGVWDPWFVTPDLCPLICDPW